MKLLHLGDLHLGKSLGEYDLIKDQRYILDQILDLVQERNVGGVLIAGDVYDKAVPSEAATKLLNYFLCELVKRKVSIYMISGNHDSDERLNYGSEMFQLNNLYISALFEGTLQKQTLVGEEGEEVDIYMLPFVKASQVRHYYPDAVIENYEDAVRTIIENTEIDATRRNVLIAHQFVSGRGGDPVPGGSEGLSVQNVGDVEKIGYSIFDAFDYVALGHIHSAQKVGREGIRYAGSPLKYSLSEAKNTKSAPIISWDENGELEIELVELVPMRNLRHITGELKTLLDPANVTNPEDFIYVSLTNEEIIPNAMGIIQQTYPNTIKLTYDNKRTKVEAKVDVDNITENKSFQELFEEFFESVYGTEMTEEELAMILAAAKEVHIIDETN